MNLLCSAEWTSSSVQTQPDPTRIFQEATKDECLIEMKEGADSPNAVQISRPVHVSFQQPDSIVYSISVSLFPPLSRAAVHPSWPDPRKTSRVGCWEEQQHHHHHHRPPRTQLDLPITYSLLVYLPPNRLGVVLVHLKHTKKNTEYKWPVDARWWPAEVSIPPSDWLLFCFLNKRLWKLCCCFPCFSRCRRAESVGDKANLMGSQDKQHLASRWLSARPQRLAVYCYVNFPSGRDWTSVKIAFSFLFFQIARARVRAAVRPLIRKWPAIIDWTERENEARSE